MDEANSISAENGDDVYDDSAIPEKRPTRYGYWNLKRSLFEVLLFIRPSNSPKSLLSFYDKEFLVALIIRLGFPGRVLLIALKLIIWKLH